MDFCLSSFYTMFESRWTLSWPGCGCSSCRNGIWRGRRGRGRRRRREQWRWSRTSTPAWGRWIFTKPRQVFHEFNNQQFYHILSLSEIDRKWNWFAQVLVLFVILIALWFFKVCNWCLPPRYFVNLWYLLTWDYVNLCRRQSSCRAGAMPSKWKLFATPWSLLGRPLLPSSCPSFSSFFHRYHRVKQDIQAWGVVGLIWDSLFFSVCLEPPPQTYDFWPFSPMKESLKNAPSLITWRLIETKMCWGVIFLLGGGFALAKVSFRQNRI